MKYYRKGKEIKNPYRADVRWGIDNRKAGNNTIIQLDFSKETPVIMKNI